MVYGRSARGAACWARRFGARFAKVEEGPVTPSVDGVVPESVNEDVDCIILEGQCAAESRQRGGQSPTEDQDR